MDRLTEYILIKEQLSKGECVSKKCKKVHDMLKTMKKSSVFSKLFTKIGNLSFACEAKCSMNYYLSKAKQAKADGDPRKANIYMMKATRWKKETEEYLNRANSKINSMRRENPQAAAAAQKIISYIMKV